MYTVRQACEADKGRLLDLIFQVIMGAEIYSESARQAEVKKYDDAKISKLISKCGLPVLVLADKNELVGFAIMEEEGGVGWIAWFGVQSSHRGVGLGRLLLEHILQICQTAGLHKLWCDTRDTNQSAANILRSAGFTNLIRLLLAYRDLLVSCWNWCSGTLCHRTRHRHCSLGNCTGYWEGKARRSTKCRDFK